MWRIRLPNLNIRVRLLASLVSSLKLVLTVVSALILTLLTYLQLSRQFAPHGGVTFPVHFIPEEFPENMSHDLGPVRPQKFLQGNFSLLTPKYLDTILYVGVEYTVTLTLILADYDVNYDEGMFFVCLKLFDANAEQAWPLTYKWTPERTSKKHGKCRSAILLRKNFISRIVEQCWKLLWSNRSCTEVLKVILEEDLEATLNKAPIIGMVTLLSHRLQVVSSTIEFEPETSFITRNPFVISFFALGCIFLFWFVMLTVVRFYEF